MIVFSCFRTSQQKYVDLGFGSVLDGSAELEQYGMISTQAVMDLIRNVDTTLQETDTHVEISDQDVDKYGIVGHDVQNGHPDNLSGKMCCCVINICLL